MKNMQFLLHLIFLLVHSVTEKSYQRFAGGKITGFLVAFQMFETKNKKCTLIKNKKCDYRIFQYLGNSNSYHSEIQCQQNNRFLCHLCVGKTILFHYFCGPSTFFRLQIKRCSSKHCQRHNGPRVLTLLTLQLNRMPLALVPNLATRWRHQIRVTIFYLVFKKRNYHRMNLVSKDQMQFVYCVYL